MFARANLPEYPMHIVINSYIGHASFPSNLFARYVQTVWHVINLNAAVTFTTPYCLVRHQGLQQKQMRESHGTSGIDCFLNVRSILPAFRVITSPISNWTNTQSYVRGDTGIHRKCGQVNNPQMYEQHKKGWGAPFGGALLWNEIPCILELWKRIFFFFIAID